MGPEVENFMGLHGQALGKKAEGAIAHLKGLIKNPSIELKGTEPSESLTKPEREKIVL